MSFASNLKTSTEFCPYCGAHVDLPLYGDYIECGRCLKRTPLAEYRFEPILTKRVYDKPKEWLIDYDRQVTLEDVTKDIPEENHEDRPTINQQCMNPTCNSNTCYYTTLQTRSADEGQTIFYECIKCSEKFVMYAQGSPPHL